MKMKSIDCASLLEAMLYYSIRDWYFIEDSSLYMCFRNSYYHHKRVYHNSLNFIIHSSPAETCNSQTYERGEIGFKSGTTKILNYDNGFHNNIGKGKKLIEQKDSDSQSPKCSCHNIRFDLMPNSMKISESWHCPNLIKLKQLLQTEQIYMYTHMHSTS